MKRNERLQAICRAYLRKMRHLAAKHGLGGWIDSTIKANARAECSGTEHEVRMLSRLCDDERVNRDDIQGLLSCSLCDINFGKIRKLPRHGIYSKVDAIMYGEKIKKRKKNGKRGKK